MSAANNHHGSPSVSTVDASRLDAMMDAFFDGELDAAGEALLLRALAAHPGKAAEFADMQRGIEMLRRPVESPDFASVVASRALAGSALTDPLVFPRRRHSWPAWTALAAGVVVAVGAGVMILREAPVVSTTSLVLPREPAVAVGERTEAGETSDVTAPVESSESSIAVKKPSRSTGLGLGPTDQHEIAGNWSLQIPAGIDGSGMMPSGVEASIASGETGGLSPGRIVSVRMGPTWSVWWIPNDAMSASSSGGEPWRILTRLASPTNASVTKER